MTRSGGHILSIGCIVGLIFSPVSLAQNGKHAEPSGQIKGIVVDAATGTPVSSISLRLLPLAGGGRIIVTSSDGSGEFTFDSVPAGRYGLDAQGSGFPLQTYEDLLNLDPGEHVDTIEFSLEPGASITGMVQDEQGHPVAEVGVLAILKNTSRQDSTYSPVGGARADERGEFRISGLPPGEYYVAAIPNGGACVSEPRSTFVCAPELYPGTRDPEAAALLTVGIGDALTDVNFTLKPVRTATVSGTVTGESSGQPIPGTEIGVRPASLPLRLLPPYLRRAQVRTDGRFKIDRIIPDSYILASLSVNANRGPVGPVSSQIQWYGQLRINVPDGQNSRNIALVDHTLPEISGSVSADHDASFDLRAVRIALVPDPDNTFPAKPVAAARPDGSFSFGPVLPGQYHLTVTGFPRKYYLKSATLGGIDVVGSDIDLSRDASSATLSILLASDGGTVTGEVVDQDDRPAADATVLLLPDGAQRNREDLVKRAYTDYAGRFTLLGVAPGSYKAFALARLSSQEFGDFGFIEKLEDFGESVDVDTNESQTLNLQLLTTPLR